MFDSFQFRGQANGVTSAAPAVESGGGSRNETSNGLLQLSLRSRSRDRGSGAAGEIGVGRSGNPFTSLLYTVIQVLTTFPDKWTARNASIYNGGIHSRRASRIIRRLAVRIQWTEVGPRIPPLGSSVVPPFHLHTCVCMYGCTAYHCEFVCIREMDKNGHHNN